MHAPARGVAIVGLGAIGRQHLAAARSRTAVPVSAVVHPHADVLEEAVRGTGTSAYGTLEELLEPGADLDAVAGVVLATPGRLHAEQVRTVLGAGKHCLVEKPLALDAGEARDLAGLARSRGLVLQVGHVLRFDDRYRALRDRVVAGELGRVGAITAGRLFSPPAAARPLHLAFEAMVHDLDQVLWLTGARVDTDSIRVARAAAGETEYVEVSLRLEDGTLVRLDAGWVSPEAELAEPAGEVTAHLEVLGAERRAGLTMCDRSSGEGAGSGWLPGLLARQLEHFWARVDDPAADGPTSLDDAVEGVRVAAAIVRADQQR